MQKALLFDLDGTLFDTSVVNYMAYKQALSEVGIEIDEAYYVEKCEGNSYKEFLTALVSPEKIDLVHERKKVLYADYLGKAKENKMLFDLILNMKEQYYIGLVTTASRKNTMQILEYFKRERLFDIIITQEDTEFLKPNPQGYNEAIKRLNVAPENVTIFEDSVTGLKAAMATEAHVVRIERF